MGEPQLLLCYPRMPLYEASLAWEQLRSQSLSEIGASIDLTKIQAQYYPLARQRAAAVELMSLRSKIHGIAEEYGFPSHVSSKVLVEFDRSVGPEIHAQMAILPADASSIDVWNFINTAVVPDVVLWRYGRFNSQNKKWSISEERLFDMTRTTIGRLWWRVHLLGVELAGKLGEDEVVNLLEKPRIGGYPLLSRALGNRLLAFASESNMSRRMVLFRDVTKRLLRRMAIQSVFVMTPEQIDEFVASLFLESAEALDLPGKATPSAKRAQEKSDQEKAFATDWPIF
ncbi:hypothetical protein ARGLB_113_00550 [Arthrobacter globiformis NBRC 12137]|uniref:Uncharacterized protein n=1 Tax=Arthrobacter globiformis (strain ATCC 8010 / DSM 20124 / JCM 1332 / NBRC 12137 / NCIMB 8907 / NRRL B-2979 / 168) TaxID=1077972 RepID=H0QTP8_ARTG1|nr:hypothetical protein [Arthrobacter globiformis]GAB16199.1 hypothetical protein ARGLB_113_00550 [Arthrobacter globiformis NBRC 12137]